MTESPEKDLLSNGRNNTETNELKEQNLALLKQIQDTRLLKNSLEERFKFEKLLSEISSVYANLPANEVDKTIEYGLQLIGKFLGADRCSLLQFSESQSVIRILNSWANEGIEALPSFRRSIGDNFPWWLSRLKHGETVLYSRLEDLPDEAAVDAENFGRLNVKSFVSVPIAVGGSIVGTLSIVAVRNHRQWHGELVPRLRLLGEVFANALVRKQKELEIRKAFLEINKLKDQLEADNSYLREEIKLAYDFHQMIGQSDVFKHMISKIHRIAATDTTVLILGETGSGKELVARAIHDASPRKDRPMVKVNCAALPVNLIESELFGHEKGAFTSAQTRQIGRFELADGSSLFLDEIGELPLESQVKLLRVLQEGEFERLGSSSTIKVDVHIIAATNRDLEEEVRKGRFRQDLWYRLNVFPISVPPLRHRKEDIPLLINWSVSKFSRKLGKSIKRVPKKVANALQSYEWPGNIRELENIIERAVINTPGESLQLLDNLEASPIEDDAIQARSTLEEVERDYILQVLEETNGRIYGPKGAALILGLNHSTLRSRMRKLGIYPGPKG